MQYVFFATSMKQHLPTTFQPMVIFNIAVYGGISIPLHRSYAKSKLNNSIYNSILINKNECFLFILEDCIF